MGEVIEKGRVGPRDSVKPLSRSKQVLFRATLLIVGWLILEAGAFLCIRLFHLEAPNPVDTSMPAVPRLQGLRYENYEEVLHPYLGFVRGETFGEPPPAASLGFDTTAYGESKPTIPKRSPDVVLVGIVGGSVAQQFGWYAPRVLTRLFKKSARYADKQFEFINLALGGYKQPQQLIAVNYLLALGAEFDIIINIDGFNEVALHESENGRQGVFPIFPRAWSTRVSSVPDPKQRRLIGELSFLASQESELAHRHRAAPWRYSKILALIEALSLRRLRQRTAAVQEQLLRVPPKASTYVFTGPRWAFADDQVLYEHLVAIWQRSSMQMHQLCKAKGIRYYHFLQPNQYVRDTKLLSPEEKRQAYQDDHPYAVGVRKGYPLLIRAGAKLKMMGVRFSDTTRIFHGHQASFYTDVCCHFNNAGMDIVTRHVAHTILTDLP